LMVTAASLVAICIAIPFMGALSDVIGRKKVMAASAIAMAIVAVPCYALIVTGDLALAVLGASVMAIVFAGHTAVLHIMLVELFPSPIRPCACGLGYSTSGASSGGTAPLLLTWLSGLTGSIYVPAIYAVVTALGTLCAVLTVEDRAPLPLRDD